MTRVCCNHFQEDCFTNFPQKKMDFATILKLKSDALPLILPGDTSSQHVGQPVTILVSLALLLCANKMRQSLPSVRLAQGPVSA